MACSPVSGQNPPKLTFPPLSQVFMTRRDILQTAHEPFGDAFYYGPERLSERFAEDEEARVKSGFSKSTYETIMDRLENDSKEVRSNPPQLFAV